MAAAAQAPAGPASTKRVVVAGGGIVGAAAAYFLAQHGVAATVVECEGLAAAASGKAGGFLALDWCDGSPVGPLARRSFALHKQLAEQFGPAAIGYRAVDTFQVAGQAQPLRSQAARKPAQLPGWLDGHITGGSRLGTTATTAQVHPAKLTRALFDAATQQAGAQLLLGSVVGVATDSSSGAVTGVRVRPKQQGGGDGSDADEQLLPADAVLLAMGPWTGAARAWLPSAPETDGQAYHSVVLRPQQPVTATAIFTAFKTEGGRSIEPEIYPRPDDTVYVCGEPSNAPLPPQGPAGVTVERRSLDVLKGVAASLASGLAGAAVEAEQACFLPLSSDGLPVIGRLPGVEGAYVATGHSCWGVLNGPATGEAVAELILFGAPRAVDLAPFDPARFTRRGAAAGAAARRR